MPGGFQGDAQASYLLLFCYFFCPQALPSLGGAGGVFLPPHLSLAFDNPLVGGNLLEGHRTTWT